MSPLSPLADVDLVAESERLMPLIEKHAAQNEAEQRLDDEVVDALVDSGIYRMWMPKELGGIELSPRESIRLLSNVAYADSAASWVLMASGLATGTTGAYIGDEAAAEIYSDGGFGLIAGQGTRMGSAKQTEGGYLLSGDWQFASGIKHARYIHTAAVIEETGEPRIFTLPVEKAEYTDNWDVLGLRATGSIDYSIRDVFVPEEWTYRVFVQEPARGGALFRLGTLNFAGICHSGWALGLGRRILDDIAEMAREGKGRAGQRKDNPAFHGEFAAIEGKYRAAEAFLMQTWKDIEETLANDEALSTRQETLVRLSLHNMTWTGVEIANFAIKAAATMSIRRGRLDRNIRDMFTGSTHLTSSQPVLEATGRELLGIQPDYHWVFADYVPREG